MEQSNQRVETVVDRASCEFPSTFDYNGSSMQIEARTFYSTSGWLYPGINKVQSRFLRKPKITEAGYLVV